MVLRDPELVGIDPVREGVAPIGQPRQLPAGQVG